LASCVALAFALWQMFARDESECATADIVWKFIWKIGPIGNGVRI
jgi:hypothetical protein